MRAAGIDIGTNSIRILIADIGSDKILKPLFKHNISTRLGQNVHAQHLLAQEAIERTLEGLKIFRRLIDDYGVETVYAVATSAVRDAANREQFLLMAENILGAKAEIVSGEMEGYLDYIGAINGLNMDKSAMKIAVVDIGGGSTEIVTGFGIRLCKSVSLDIGAVRLTEMIPELQLPLPSGLDQGSDIVDDMLQITLDKDIKADMLIGIGGTVTSLAAVSQGLLIYSREKIHGYKLTRHSIKRMLDEFINTPLEDRKRIPGLQPQRADIIIAGVLILLRLLKWFGEDEITVSEYDNLEGLIWSRLGYVEV